MNSDICTVITKYIYKPSYKLLDWIDINKLNWCILSSNPNVIDLLRENIINKQDKIDWEHLSSNPNAIELLQENPNKINWYHLSSNPNAIELLKENQDKINWDILSSNPSIFDNNEEIETNIQKILEIILIQ